MRSRRRNRATKSPEWPSLFREVRASSRRGTASGNPFTVRALAYIVAGQAAHHAAILGGRYLPHAAG
jgi:hypothetical protein